MQTRIYCHLIVFALSLVLITSAAAQTNVGQITGNVFDASGAPIAGVRLAAVVLDLSGRAIAQGVVNSKQAAT